MLPGLVAMTHALTIARTNTQTEGDMSDEKEGACIADNPSAQRMSAALLLMKAARSITGLLKKFGISNEGLNKLYQAADDALKRSDILNLPDRFNTAFSGAGWIATGSMSADTMRKAVELYESGSKQEAEEALLAWFQEDTIDMFAIQRAKRFNKSTNRWHQLREALKLTFEGRYWSAVPLILIACDGFASDVMGTSPFEQDADLTVFDSVVGHPTSLPFLIGKLTKGIRKSSDDEITLPLRHGILHGRSLGYANRIVCMKAWLLMIALVDWAHDKSNENDRKREQQSTSEVSFRDVVKGLLKLEEDKRAMAAFEAREIIGPFNDNLDADSPEYAILEFLTRWKDRNYGRMAERAVNWPRQSIGKLAGQLRRDGEIIELHEFEVHSVRRSTIARADATAFLKGKTPSGDVQGEFQITAFLHTENGDIAMPSTQGKWLVQQACMFDLLHGRTLEQG